MEYPVFEGRVLELVYKTDARLTPQFVAYKLGCPVGRAQALLEQMAGSGILSLESDDAGALYFDMAGRPAASGEPLSWQDRPASDGAASTPAAPSPSSWPAGTSWPAAPAAPVVVHVAAPVMVAPPKSVAVAILLAILFGPLGMLYATVAGGLVMMIVSLLVGIATLGAGWIVTWPVCVIWAALSAGAYNDRIRQPVGGGGPRPGGI